MLLSKDDLSLIKKLFALPKDTLEDSDSPKAYTSGIDTKLYPLLKKILQNHIDMEKLDIHVAFRLDSFKPWSIHTDYPKGDMSPALALLIPLITTDSNTIIFNEECLDDFSFFMRSKPPLDPKISAINHSDLLSHISRDQLSRVSIKSIEPWIEGKIISWDRKLLHCSDNYKGKGIQSKQAAVIFTSHRNQ